MDKNHEILNFAVDTGEALLKFGGEIYRVKDTIDMILDAFHIPDHDVYVLSNGIFVSMTADDEQVCSTVRDIPLESINLSGITAINQLSRDICDGKLPLPEAKEALQRACNISSVSDLKQDLACGLGCGAFCFLFGGSFSDTLIAFVCGFLLQVYLITAKRHRISRFLSQILGSALVTAISILALEFRLPIHQDRIVIGAIMPLVPGVVFTTSIRDFFNGDYLSGTIHMIDALLTAFSIAIGVGSVITVYRIISGGALLP